MRYFVLALVREPNVLVLWPWVLIDTSLVHVNVSTDAVSKLTVFELSIAEL